MPSKGLLDYTGIVTSDVPAKVSKGLRKLFSKKPVWGE